MAVVEGFSYTELRDMPLPELLMVQAEVVRIGELRKKALSKNRA